MNKKNNIKLSSEILIDVQESERAALISPIHHIQCRQHQSQIAIDALNRTKVDLIKNHEIAFKPRTINSNLNAIIDQEANNRAISYVVQSPKHNKFIFDKLVYQQRCTHSTDIDDRQQSIQNVINILNHQMNSERSERFERSERQHESDKSMQFKAIILSQKEAEERWISYQINNTTDEAIQTRNCHFVSVLVKSWQLNTDKLFKQKQMIMRENKKLQMENVKQVQCLQKNEMERRVQLFPSNKRFTIIGYDELNYMSDLEVIERQNECIDFLLYVSIKCDKLRKLKKKRDSKLLQIYNKRQEQIAKRKHKINHKKSSKTKTDWILYTNCKNLLNTKKLRMLKQINQWRSIYRLTNKRDIASNNIMQFLFQNKLQNNHQNPTVAVSPQKHSKSSDLSVSSYSNPTFTSHSKLNRQNIRDPKHEKIFKKEKLKILSKSQTASPSPKKLELKRKSKINKFNITVDTNISSSTKHKNEALFSNKSNIDISEYISPINEYLKMQSNAINQCENGIVTSSVNTTEEKEVFNVNIEHKATPNKNIFKRLSQPKKRTIPHFVALQQQKEKDLNEDNKIKRKRNSFKKRESAEKKEGKKKSMEKEEEKRITDSTVFDKLYKDAKVRKTKHTVAKNLADSAVLENIRKQCSFTPKLYKSEAIINLENDGKSIQERMKKWETQREHNLLKLMETDPNRLNCTFQPNINNPKSPIYDYKHPNSTK